MQNTLNNSIYDKTVQLFSMHGAVIDGGVGLAGQKSVGTC